MKKSAWFGLALVALFVLVLFWQLSLRPVCGPGQVTLLVGISQWVCWTP